MSKGEMKKKIIFGKCIRPHQDELPTINRTMKIGIKDSRFLKLHQSKGGIHEGDRERASSIIANLVYKQHYSKYDSTFNKEPIPEKSIELKAEQLYTLGQMESSEYSKQKENNEILFSHACRFINKKRETSNEERKKKVLTNLASSLRSKNFQVQNSARMVSP